jgi:hypothetical protein
VVLTANKPQTSPRLLITRMLTAVTGCMAVRQQRHLVIKGRGHVIYPSDI